MPRGPEAKIQDAAVLHARKKPNGIAQKMEAGGGFPDYFFSFPASGPFLVEFKAPGKKARPDQFNKHKELTRAGVRVYLVSGTATAIRLIDDMADFGATDFPMAGVA